MTMTKPIPTEITLKNAEPLVHPPAPEIQGGARAWFSTQDRDDNAGRLDVVAGSEFLDDRIRLRE